MKFIPRFRTFTKLIFFIRENQEIQNQRDIYKLILKFTIKLSIADLVVVLM